MIRKPDYLIAVLIIANLVACSRQQGKTGAEKVPLLDAYFEAFNYHDVDGLLAMTSEDIRMMSITPDTMLTDLKGKQALQNWLEGYFKTFPNVRSSYAALSSRQPFYSFVETASWGPDSARKQQSSMATYMIIEDKIHRLWYYYPE